MVETKRFKTTAEDVKDIITLQLLKGVDKPFGVEKEEIKNTELLKGEKFVKAETVTVRVKKFEDGTIVAIYEDRPLKETYAELITNGKRIFIENIEKPEKEISKGLVADIEDLEELGKISKELAQKVKKALGDEGIEKRAVAGALINQQRILPFATFSAENAIMAVINKEKLEKLNQEIEALRNKENLTEEEQKKLEELYKERRKAYQPYLPLALGINENGTYIKPNSLYRLGENLNYSVEGKNIVLLIPIIGVAQGRLTYKRLGFIPTSKVQTDILRRRFYVFRKALEDLLGGKDIPKNVDGSLKNRLNSLKEFLKKATEEEKEEIKAYIEELKRADDILYSILFPKTILSPYMFDTSTLSEEEFSSLTQTVRETEKKIESELLEKYGKEIARIASVLRKLEGKTIKIRRSEGVTEEVFEIENLKTKDIYTTNFIRSLAKKMNIDIDQMVKEFKELEIISPSGETVKVNGFVHSILNNLIGMEYVRQNTGGDIEGLEDLKEFVEKYIETGRKPIQRQPVEFEVDIPDEILFGDIDVSEGDKQGVVETEKKGNIEELLFGENGKDEDDLDNLLE
jgi:hypothetical protein